MTLNPTNGDRSKIAIDASWGLGEAVVSGEVTPDHFMVDKVILEIIKSVLRLGVKDYNPITPGLLGGIHSFICTADHVFG